jgi:hypothetical protein
MFKNVLATRLVRYIVLNLMRENLTFYLSECNYVLLLYFDVEFQQQGFKTWMKSQSLTGISTLIINSHSSTKISTLIVRGGSLKMF